MQEKKLTLVNQLNNTIANFDSILKELNSKILSTSDLNLDEKMLALQLSQQLDHHLYHSPFEFCGKKLIFPILTLQFTPISIRLTEDPSEDFYLQDAYTYITDLLNKLNKISSVVKFRLESSDQFYNRPKCASTAHPYVPSFEFLQADIFWEI